MAELQLQTHLHGAPCRGPSPGEHTRSGQNKDAGSQLSNSICQTKQINCSFTMHKHNQPWLTFKSDRSSSRNYHTVKPAVVCVCVCVCACVCVCVSVCVCACVCVCVTVV